MSSVQHRDIDQFEIVGRGANAGPNGTIIVEAGWDVDSAIEAAVVLRVRNQIKYPRIQAEFRGYTETRWEGLNKLASRPPGPNYKVHRIGKVFQQIVDVVYESRHPLVPNPNGSSVNFPFSFRLPKKGMPPSFDSVCGSIDYYVKVGLTFQEGGLKMLKSTVEVVMPVTVFIPERAKIRMLALPSQFSHTTPLSDEKIQYSVNVPKKILQIGSSLEMDLIINATPGTARLRTFYASLRPIVAYLNNDNVAQRATFPRPLSEVTRSFNFVTVKPWEEPITLHISLLIDSALAQPSFESQLIRIQTMLRIQMTTDESEIPNISHEFPVLVLPAVQGGSAPLSAPLSPLVRNGSSDMQRPSLDVPDSPAFPSMLGRHGSVASFSPLPEPGMMLPAQLQQGANEYSTVNSAFAQPGGNQHSPASIGVNPLTVRSAASTVNLADGYHSVRNMQSTPVLSGNYTMSPPMTSQEMQTPAPTPERPTTIFKGPHYPPELHASDDGIHGDAPPQYVDPAQQLEQDEAAERLAALKVDPPSEWTMAQVGEWIKQIVIPEVAEEISKLFIGHEIDGSVLLDLTDEDLKVELGITVLARRRKILAAITRLKGGSSK